MALPHAVRKPAPRGIAFSISEHMALRHWAAGCSLRVVTELDRVICGEEYEEVLAFYQPSSCWRRLTLWRRNDAFVLEPSVGASRHFPCVREATQAATALLRALPHQDIRPQPRRL